MSRSNYTDDSDSNWELIKWRGMVASATRGKRGQQFFKDLIVALDAMPEKRLITEELEKDGEVCAIGSLGRMRGVSMAEIDPEDPEQVSNAFGIATCLAQEVMYMNDEWYDSASPEELWKKMRTWAEKQVAVPAGSG